MMRTIDADALQKRLKKKKPDPAAPRYVEGFNDALLRFKSMVHSAPTIEPERKKGKWLLSDEQRREDTDNGNYRYVCSNCLHSDIHAKTQEVPYCWWCGAYMKGGQE